MIIASSEMKMASARSFYSGNSIKQTIKQEKTTGTDLLKTGNGQEDFFGTLNYFVNNKNLSNLSNNSSNESTNTRVRFQTLSYLFQLLFASQLHGQKFGSIQSMLGNGLFTTSSIETTYTYEEYEETSFYTTGKVIDSSGREIDFDVELTMSRSFMESYSEVQNFANFNTMDPLVINFDCPVTSVSDQKFYFDLDCDGNDENISMLGSGSGFLALDKNCDGKINDGSELFGTKSGNGFKDLAAYDLDNNGWIDEADEIFDKLWIYAFDSDGNSKLYKLKDKDVGAICLQNMDTEFSVKDKSNNTDAIVRRSGIFLRESGGASTISHVDLAM